MHSLVSCIPARLWCTDKALIIDLGGHLGRNKYQWFNKITGL